MFHCGYTHLLCVPFEEPGKLWRNGDLVSTVDTVHRQLCSTNAVVAAVLVVDTLMTRAGALQVRLHKVACDCSHDHKTTKSAAATLRRQEIATRPCHKAINVVSHQS